jgi:hypothetical protein
MFSTTPATGSTRPATGERCSGAWKPSVSYRATLTGVIITRNRIGTGSNTYQETLTVTDAAGLKNSLTKTINFRQ